MLYALPLKSQQHAVIMPEPSILLSIIDGVVEVALNPSAKSHSPLVDTHAQPALEVRRQSATADMWDPREGMAVLIGMRKPAFQGRWT